MMRDVKEEDEPGRTLKAVVPQSGLVAFMNPLMAFRGSRNDATQDRLRTSTSPLLQESQGARNEVVIRGGVVVGPKAEQALDWTLIFKHLKILSGIEEIVAKQDAEQGHVGGREVEVNSNLPRVEGADSVSQGGRINPVIPANHFKIGLGMHEEVRVVR